MNKLLQSAHPIFQRLTDFIECHKKELFDLALFNEFDDQIEQFKRSLLSQNIPLEKILSANYALIALIDDVMIHSNWSLKEKWQEYSLQMKFFSEHGAEVRFYHKLSELRQQPQGQIDVIEFFHTCLLYGFQGFYRRLNQERRDSLIKSIGEQLLQLKYDLYVADKFQLQKSPSRFHQLLSYLCWGIITLLGMIVILFCCWIYRAI